jgi:flagellar protein FlaG
MTVNNQNGVATFSSELQQSGNSGNVPASLKVDREIEHSIKKFQQEAIQDTRNQKETRETLQTVARDMNTLLEENISFHYHEEASSMYVVVSDIQTGDEIRRIPSDEALKLSALMKEIGNIFDRRG